MRIIIKNSNRKNIMGMLKARVGIVGKKTILFHRFSVDTITLHKKERTGVAGNDPEEWKRSVLMTESRQLYLDSTYVFGCFRDGGKHIKSGKGTILAKIASTLVVLDEIILLDRFVPLEPELTTDKTKPVYIDVRSVKNPSTKGRNVRYRIAASPGWRIAVDIAWDGTVVGREQMKAAVCSAADLVGLGDGRAIGLGRFAVEEFEVTDYSPV